MRCGFRNRIREAKKKAKKTLVRTFTMADSSSSTEQESLASYRLLKLIITANRGGGESMVQLARVAFAFVPQVVSVTNPKGSNPYHEKPRNLLDGQVHTKWLDFNLTRNGCSELIFEVGASRSSNFSTIQTSTVQPQDRQHHFFLTGLVGGLLRRHPPHPVSSVSASTSSSNSSPHLKPTYQLWTANDCPQRDPTSWTLLGQRDGSDEWDILDVQECVDPPYERYTAYPEFKLNFGIKNNKGKKRKQDKLLKLIRMTSMEVLPALDPTRKGYEFEVLPEYQRAKDAVVVKWEFMATSKVQTALKIINDLRGSLPNVSFSDTLCRAIAKAYNLGSIESARGQYCALGDYHLVSAITNLYNSLEWRSQYLHFALWLSLRLEEPVGLMTCLNLLARGGSECHARKLMAFHTFIQRIATASTASSSSSASTSDASSSSSSSAFEHSRMLLLDWMRNYIDNLKLKAFTSTFIEPARFYFCKTGQTVMMDDVEVHGSNTYLAVLLSTLGIKLGLMPFFRDEVKGCCDFLKATSYNSIYQEITDPKHAGKSWRNLPNAKRCNSSPNVYITSGFIFPGVNPLTVAFHAASSNSSENSRRALAQYLEIYTRYFSKEHFLERAFLNLIGDEGLPQPLAVVFAEMMKNERRTAPEEEGEEGEADVNEWIYDVKNGYTFNLERAAQLFAFIGVTN
jgi:hypothetical protein